MMFQGEENFDKKDGLEVKSRDFSIPSPSKRKSKKKSEATTAQASSSSSSETHIQTGQDSPIINFKFILGVAIVSIIFGVILGKRY
jgi:hypothetical protein